jgi:hypothetical protein
MQHAENCSGSHHQGEGDRKHPDRRRAQLRAPDADRHHGDHVIDAGQWMQ